jgi:hypothetical protein
MWHPGGDHTDSVRRCEGIRVDADEGHDVRMSKLPPDERFAREHLRRQIRKTGFSTEVRR